MEEPYETCAFPKDKADYCIVQSGDTDEEKAAKQAANCYTDQHPQCPSGYCVNYHGSSPFCSDQCEDDSDCEEGGKCREFALDCVTDDEGNTVCPRLCVKKSAL